MSRFDLIGTLRQEGRGSIGSLGRSRARQILVISELALSHPSPLPLIREGIETMDNEAPVIDGPIVSPEYFHLLGMPLLRGRLFNDRDLEDTPQVAVINQAAANTWWPNQDPLGKRVRLRLDTREQFSSAEPAWTTIVGVIADARTESLADLP